MLPTSIRKVQGSNSTEGGIQLLTTTLHCTDSLLFINTFSLSLYNLNNVERDVKHQIIIEIVILLFNPFMHPSVRNGPVQRVEVE